MKILCVSKYASPPKYGVAARLFYLAKEFASLGHEVTLMTSDSNHLASYPKVLGNYFREDVNGVDLICFRNTKYKKTASIARIISWFDFEKSLFSFSKKKIFKPDVVIVSSLSMLSIFYGYYLKKKFRVPLVFEVRDIWPLTLTAEAGVSKLHPLTLFLSWVEKFAYRKSDLVVGTMPRLDVHIEKVLGVKRPFFCSPLGFDFNIMKERSQDEFPQLRENFPKGKVIIGYAGSMGLSNNLDSFIETISELKHLNNLHFVLVGSGDLRAKYVQQLEGVENVSFLPRISPTQVPYFLSLCDVLYLSTHDSEVWEYGQSMNKVVEYMYSAKPIIASYSGFPSMVNEAHCGYFVRSNDKKLLKEKISYLASMGKEERTQLGLNGRSWILKNRDYSVLAKQYLECLNQLIEQKKGS